MRLEMRTVSRVAAALLLAGTTMTAAVASGGGAVAWRRRLPRRWGRRRLPRWCGRRLQRLSRWWLWRLSRRLWRLSGLWGLPRWLLRRLRLWLRLLWVLRRFRLWLRRCAAGCRADRRDGGGHRLGLSSPGLLRRLCRAGLSGISRTSLCAVRLCTAPAAAGRRAAGPAAGITVDRPGRAVQPRPRSTRQRRVATAVG